MPALENPRWERFCLAIVQGVCKRGEKYSQGRAYIEAGYNSKPGNSAYANASRLIIRDKIANRIAELLAEAQDKATKKRAYTINEVTERLALASRIAEEDRIPSALTQAERAIAEVRGLIIKNANTSPNGVDFKNAQSMAEIGRMLLQSVGFVAPDDVSIADAVSLNNVFVEGLEAIRRRADATLQLEDDS